METELAQINASMAVPLPTAGMETVPTGDSAPSGASYAELTKV